MGIRDSLPCSSADHYAYAKEAHTRDRLAVGYSIPHATETASNGYQFQTERQWRRMGNNKGI
jgi:hypothetical protein